MTTAPLPDSAIRVAYRWLRCVGHDDIDAGAVLERALGEAARSDTPCDFGERVLRCVRCCLCDGPNDDRATDEGRDSILPCDGTMPDDVAAAIALLPFSVRVVTALYFAADLSYAQLAAVLEWPLAIVRQRLHAGRRLLGRRLLARALVSPGT